MQFVKNTNTYSTHKTHCREKDCIFPSLQKIGQFYFINIELRYIPSSTLLHRRAKKHIGNYCLLPRNLLEVTFLFQGGRTTRLDRKESYKAQRRSYAKEKKRVERELLSTFKGN